MFKTFLQRHTSYMEILTYSKIRLDVFQPDTIDEAFFGKKGFCLEACTGFCVTQNVARQIFSPIEAFRQMRLLGLD